MHYNNTSRIEKIYSEMRNKNYLIKHAIMHYINNKKFYSYRVYLIERLYDYTKLKVDIFNEYELSWLFAKVWIDFNPDLHPVNPKVFRGPINYNTFINTSTYSNLKTFYNHIDNDQDLITAIKDKERDKAINRIVYLLLFDKKLNPIPTYSELNVIINRIYFRIHGKTPKDWTLPILNLDGSIPYNQEDKMQDDYGIAKKTTPKMPEYKLFDVKTFIEGVFIEDLSNEALYSAIERGEAQVEKLSKIKSKPLPLMSKIQEIKDGVESIVKYMDKERK